MAGADDTTLPEPPLPPSRRDTRSGSPGIVVAFCRAPRPASAIPVAAARTIGRDEAADIRIDDPSVSRLHARFEPAPGGLLVTDLGSQNGTFADGIRVGTPVVVPFGRVVRMGGTVLIVVPDSGAFSADGPAIPGLVGGAGLGEVRRHVAAVAASAASVLIEGETGSGKEIVARAIHRASGRSGDLVAVNCAAIASELVESELFGHARGAFSGAQGARAGLFRAADGGTLMLDEIGELRPAVQAKLLRALETGEVRGVGEDRASRVDVRVVAATHRSLSSLVTSGGFRADLYHRIAALRVRVPALREHLEDIPLLCEHFLDGTGVSVTAAAVDALLRRPWPGNVRELRNAVQAAAGAARSQGRDVLWPADVEEAPAPAGPREEDDDLRGRIVAALRSCDGDVRRAATELGMSRSVLYETLRRLHVEPKAHRPR